tara:strand:+ start:36 stop:305 length:270 start_codon:yes stop_codon:yes gene_type:complete
MFEKHIIKFLSGTATLDELMGLMKYLEVNENSETFKSYVRINYYSIHSMNDIDRKDILEIVQKRISSEKKKSYRKKSGDPNGNSAAFFL